MTIDIRDGDMHAVLEIRGEHIHVRISDHEERTGAILVDPADVDFIADGIATILDFIATRAAC